MRGRILAQLLLAIVAAGCGGTTSQEYLSPEGRYRVQFPGKPKITDQTVPTHVGPIINKVAATKDWSQTERTVAYADFPGGLIHLGNKDRMLDGACQGLATESNLIIQGKMPIMKNGHPGREVSFETQEGHPAGKLTGRARIYLIGARLYQIFIAGPRGRITTETMDSYLDSFELLDQGPGPGFPPGPSPPTAGRPPGSPPHPATGPNPPVAPTDRAAPLSFYNIPEPATATIEADLGGMGGTPRDADVQGLGGSPAAPASSGGASIRSFEWVDGDTDVVGGQGAAPGPDGANDQHFRLRLDLPPRTIIESLAISNGLTNRWVTQASDQWGPIAIYQDGRAVFRSYVAQVGFFSGPQAFDLYISPSAEPASSGPIELQVVLSIDGRRVPLSSRCVRPEQPFSALADARPRQAPPATPSSPAPGPAATPARQPQLATRPDPSPSGRQPTEIPVLLKPSSGGATIASFNWLDRDDDHAGTSIRQIGPGGGKDEHFQLALDLPTAAIIEEITITGGGVLWTTKPVPRSWPVAIVANHVLKNRAQMRTVGAFSGKWTLDLYAESQDVVRPDHVVGVEVVVLMRGNKHHLTAHCQSK